MLKLKNVDKEFDKFKLKNISFELPRGYIMGLVGQNGSGKTTIINLVLGLYKVNSGSIYIDGKDITKNEKEVKDKVGFVLCDDVLGISSLTLKQNADFYGKYYSRYSSKEFINYCDKFEIDINKKMNSLSTGEKLKFQFAFALSHKPKLLVLDEPVGNFDPEFKKEFLQSLLEFIEDGEHSILISTNTTTELEQISDYITMIKSGEVLFSEEKETLCDKFKLVIGDDSKINSIGEDNIIYKEKSQHNSNALIVYDENYEYDRELIIQTPSIDDIMYYFVKGEKNV